jgi:hypothetical protein
MPINSSLLRTPVLGACFSLLAIISVSLGAPLSSTTAAHVKPDENSAVITVLSAGTAPTVATDASAATPAGWLAVELTGPFQGFVFARLIRRHTASPLGSPRAIISSTLAAASHAARSP